MKGTLVPRSHSDKFTPGSKQQHHKRNIFFFKFYPWYLNYRVRSVGKSQFCRYININGLSIDLLFSHKCVLPFLCENKSKKCQVHNSLLTLWPTCRISIYYPNIFGGLVLEQLFFIKSTWEKAAFGLFIYFLTSKGVPGFTFSLIWISVNFFSQPNVLDSFFVFSTLAVKFLKRESKREVEKESRTMTV